MKGLMSVCARYIQFYQTVGGFNAVNVRRMFLTAVTHIRNEYGEYGMSLPLKYANLERRTNTHVGLIEFFSMR